MQDQAGRKKQKRQINSARAKWRSDQVDACKEQRKEAIRVWEEKCNAAKVAGLRVPAKPKRLRHEKTLEYFQEQLDALESGEDSDSEEEE